MRILVLTIDFPPLGGGISRWTWTLCRALARQDVRVLAPDSESACDAGKEASGIRVHRGPFFRKVPVSWNLRDLLRYLLHSHRLVSEERPDLVLAAQAGIPAFAAYVIARLHRIPLVVAGHGEELERASRSGIRRLIARLVSRRAALVLANSTSTTDLFVALGAPREKTRRWVAVDPVSWGNPAPADLSVSTPPVVLSVGRIDPRKGQDRVLQALPLIRERFPSCEYWIVGSGPSEALLRERIRKDPALSSVRMFGKVTDEALREIYSRCSVFALPSREARGEREGLGLVFLEAALFGKPVVAGRVGGVGDAVLHGRTGLLVDPEDPEEIARAIAQLLDDAPLRRRMGLRAWERVHRRFTLPVASARLEGWLQSVVGNSGGASA
ncbi:MAG: glycosyltransferase family 4 protein [Candidatus Eisenbacteria bacterium]